MKKPAKNSTIRLSALLLFFVSFGCFNWIRGEETHPFEFILMPDTQAYAWKHPDLGYEQAKWIADNAERFAFVLHLGDLTNNNTPAQWNGAEFAMRLLDGKIPYVLAQGNHDIGKNGKSDTRDSTLMNRFFPYEKYSQIKGFGGAYEPGKIDNTWFTFQEGGVDWLILSLEFAPRNRVLDWAKEIVERHPKHKVMIDTHGYMYSDNTLLGSNPEHKGQPKAYEIGKATGPDAANDGVTMWENFVSRYPNIMFVFSGHIGYDHGVGLLVDKGKHGNLVYQILVDHQKRPNGGEGYLAILKVDVKKRTVEVKNYSPILNRYLEDHGRQYVLENVDFGSK